MKVPLGISELVRLIGDENIQVQNVMANLTNVQNPKHGRCSKITVTIAPNIGQELCAAGMAGQRPRKTGLILWFDTDKIPPIDPEEDQQPTTGFPLATIQIGAGEREESGLTRIPTDEECTRAHQER